jgi:nitroreductase
MMDPKELLALMRSRRSVRRFTGKAPPREVVATLIEAARWAPSNHNRQGFRFIVFEDREEIARLAQDVRSSLREKVKAGPTLLSPFGDELVESASWFGDAPVLILVLHKRPAAVGRSLLEGTPSPPLVSGEPLSAAMAVENMLLMARALDLGTCVLTAPLLAREVIEAIPDLPPGYEVTCFVVLGYAAEEPAEPPRKRIDQLTEFRTRR